MKHHILDQHAVIAWDMDKTLVGGPNSKFFRDYIKAHPEKSHHVVTFRDAEWAKDIEEELAQEGLPFSCILAVHSCPELVHDMHMVNIHPFKADVKKDMIESRLIDQDQLNDFSYRFLEYKGAQAKAIGATVLVDDLVDWCIRGCEKNGVVLLNSLDPIS